MTTRGWGLGRVAGVMLVAAVGLVAAAPSAISAAATSARAGRTNGLPPVTELSKSCPASSSEVEEATDPSLDYVYVDWIGCQSEGIGFVRSTDGGTNYSAPRLLPGSAHVFTWDPAIAVAANGVVYASFMAQENDHSYPIVDVSFNHGETFARSVGLVPVVLGNWGDRDFVAPGPGDTVYVTWDYGPAAAAVKFLCPPNGSCSFSNGDLNIVVQKSTNEGRTWGPMVHVSPGFPASGADLAPIVVEPNGQVDVVFQRHSITNPKTYALGPAHFYFTKSTDGGAHWSTPLMLGPPTRTISDAEWWIDGDVGLDSGGNLYATWDTQNRDDFGWLSYSTDHGATWSTPRRVTPDTDDAVHIVQVAGTSPGEAVIGWQSDNSPKGYGLSLRPYSISKGWLAPAVHISGSLYGSSAIWPGDTFGIAFMPGAAGAGSQQMDVAWGSGDASTGRDDIYAATANLAA